MKTFLAFSAALLLATFPALADSRHGGHNGGGHFRGGRGGYHHGGGRFYYYGGVPYFYPYASFGFGDPYWYGAGAYYDGYPGDIDDRYYGVLRPYEGRIVDETSPDRIKQMKAARALPTAVQRQLAERGYYKGSIDGQFGPGSKEALRHFQRDKRLKQTGMIDEPSLHALGFGDR